MVNGTFSLRKISPVCQLSWGVCRVITPIEPAFSSDKVYVEEVERLVGEYNGVGNMARLLPPARCGGGMRKKDEEYRSMA